MATKKTIIINVDTSNATSSVNELDGQVQDLNEDLNKTEKESSNAMDGIAKGSKKASTSVGLLSKGFSGLGTAIKATGIGLLVALLASLFETLKGNQKVLDALDTGLNAVKIVVNDLFNFISNNAGGVVTFFKNIFNDPLESIQSFGNAIKENLIERFESYLDTLGFVAEGVKNLFSGDFDGALESFKSAGKESLDVFTGVNNTFDKSVEIVGNATTAITEYATETVKASQETTQLAKDLVRLGLEQDRLNEKYDRDAELQRQIRDDSSRSIEDRISANQELGRILQEQANAQDANVQKRIDILKKEQEELGYSEDRANEIYALETERIAIQAKITGIRSEQLSNENALLLEQKEALEELRSAEDMYDQEQADKKKEKEAKEKKDAEELAKYQENLDKRVSANKVAVTKSLVNSVTELMGKSSAASKALAIAETTWSTYQSIQAALGDKEIPFPLRLANSIAAGLMGAINVKSIISTPNPVGPDSGGNGNINTPRNTSPQINVVGDSGINQLSESINGINANPVRAYVVSTDIESQAQLDRDIESSASF